MSAGGEAGVTGCRLLHHSVQAHWPPAHGSRQEQLQALGGAGSVRHAQRHDHLHHAGEQEEITFLESAFVDEVSEDANLRSLVIV